jgi:hypothetical protein
MKAHQPVIYAEIVILLSIILLILKNKKIIIGKQITSYLIISLPIIFFFSVIYLHTDNVPFQDDWVLLDSLYQMKTATNILDFSKAFFQQVNQHRFGFERIVFVVIHEAFGNENIKAQIILGDCFLLGIAYLFFHFFKKLNLSISYFTPIPLLLFNLTFFENANWGIAAIQNTPIIFFAFLTVYFLSKSSSVPFYIALITAIITMFTSGNGLSIWPIGFAILFLQNRKKELIVWSIFATVLLLFYFNFDYTFIQSDRSFLFQHPLLNIIFVLTFFGNIFFQNIPHPYVIPIYGDIVACIILGCFLFTIIIGVLRKVFQEKRGKISPQTLQLFGWFGFLAITGLMLMLSRPVEIRTYHGGEFLSRRYMIFGAAFACVGYLAYLFLIQQKKEKLNWGFHAFFLMGVFINLNSYYTSIPSIYRQQQELRLDGHFWKKDTMLLSFGEKYKEKFGYNHPTYQINLIKKVDSLGIYKLSDNEIKPIFSLLKNSSIHKSELFEGKIDTVVSIGTTISLEKRPKVSFVGMDSQNKGIVKYIGLKTENNAFIFPAIFIPNKIQDCLTSQTYYSSKFYYDIWQAKIPSGKYEIWLISEENNNYNAKFSKKIVEL